MEIQVIRALTDKSTLSRTTESFVREITRLNAVRYAMNTKDEVITEYHTNHRAVSAMLLLRGITIEEDVVKRIR
jgi:hypothetical protein